MGARASSTVRAALVQAAAAFRRADGTYDRERIRVLADLNGVSERTARRWLFKASTLDDPDIVGTRRQSPARPDQAVLLLAVANSPQSMRGAWQWLQEHHGYALGYRTFLRDLNMLSTTLVSGAREGFPGAVRDRVYLSTPLVHRNQQWHLDHTMANVYVKVDRGTAQFRPWITNLVDRSTGKMLAIEAWEGRPNTETVTATLIRATCGDTGPNESPTSTGGLPNVLVFDNAMEHFSEAVQQGCLLLGIVASPTTPYHSWENGIVERSHRTLDQQFLSTLPGHIHAGDLANHDPRYGPRGPGYASPTALLAFSRFRQMLESWRVRYNTSQVGSDGRTPQERWEADPTTLRPISPELMLAHMTIEDRLHTVNKSGIRFRGADYVCAGLGPLRTKQVTVRYLPSVREWIEVFDGDDYVGRAWRQDVLPEVERNKVLLERARVEKAMRATERDALNHRNHLAEVEGEMFDGEHAGPSPDILDVTDGVPAKRPKLPATTTTKRSGPATKATAQDVAALTNLIDVSHLTVIDDQEAS
jgi:putative transposase